ncbi:hypothetical protein DAI22_10g086300 [Oryza sativa Japonica Group]|nr:hypothetical protein DAI22_10g086300 [Oryza sativa Japonica Group]
MRRTCDFVRMVTGAGGFRAEAQTPAARAGLEIGARRSNSRSRGRTGRSTRVKERERPITNRKPTRRSRALARAPDRGSARVSYRISCAFRLVRVRRRAGGGVGGGGDGGRGEERGDRIGDCHRRLRPAGEHGVGGGGGRGESAAAVAARPLSRGERGRRRRWREMGGAFSRFIKARLRLPWLNPGRPFTEQRMGFARGRITPDFNNFGFKVLFGWHADLRALSYTSLLR